MLKKIVTVIATLEIEGAISIFLSLEKIDFKYLNNSILYKFVY